MKYLPNLFVIGAMKCGTTSLHAYLNCHPDIFMSEKKEMDFFIKELNWEKGIDWYRTYFPENMPVRGESSQNYTKYHWWPGVPERIADLVEAPRFIYILRDPVARLYSHYAEMQEQHVAPKDLNAYLCHFADNEMVRTSMYHWQLLKFLEYFDKSQIHVLTLGELKSKRLETMNGIFRFLGLQEMKNEELFDFEKNRSVDKKQHNMLGAHLLSPKRYSKIKKLLPGSAKTRIRESEWFRKVAFTKVSKTKIDEKLEREIRDFLKQDVNALRKLTGKSFSDWSL